MNASESLGAEPVMRRRIGENLGWNHHNFREDTLMRWLIPIVATLPFLIMACDSDDDSDPTIEPEGTPAATLPAASPESSGPDASDSEDLGSVDTVRDLLGSVSGIDPEMISDVQFEGRTLTIMLDQDDSFAESNDVQSICTDLNNAIGLADLEVVIESSSGGQLAQCTFTG